MSKNDKNIVDVALKDLSFPIKVLSRESNGGQITTANVSLSARIVQKHDERWLDDFIRIIQQHHNQVSTATLRADLADYLKNTNAIGVNVEIDYPYFIEKVTPASHQKCLVQYRCTYSARMSATDKVPRITFKIDVPVITTDPASNSNRPNHLFGQLSVVTLEIQSYSDFYPEDLVDMVDRHALSPVYSLLAPEDKSWMIEKVHSQQKSCILMADEVKADLAHTDGIDWYAVHCANFSMLQSYNTAVGTQKSMWVPSNCYDFAGIS